MAWWCIVVGALGVVIVLPYVLSQFILPYK